MTKKTKSSARCRKDVRSFLKQKQVYDTTTAQRQRLLDWLRTSPITTCEARAILNILLPAARIFELRHQFGHNIAMRWIVDEDFFGRPHRIGEYALLSGKWKGDKK